MRILAIESSCDETGAAVIEKNKTTIKVLSNITATSLAIHAATGGIIPENAAREQVKYIIPTIIKALCKSRIVNQESWEEARIILKKEIDAIAVTHGPGLIGSLLVGVETAKTLSFAFNKPIIPVHHLLAHIYANFISPQTSIPYSLPTNPYPYIGLIVSGGHTDLLYFKSINNYKWLGGTRDDAAGEAIDKIGRLLNLAYPAGPEIEERAKKITKPSIKFKSPLLNSDDFDFSFSGLKTEAMRFIQKNQEINEQIKNEVCFAVQKAVVDVLVKKTVRAAELYNTNTILLGGGVSANETLMNEFKLKIENLKLKINVFSPKKTYCTDNAAMIGAYALMNYKPVNWRKIDAMPDLYFV
ncbi:MAG: tRNA (adenosine(37)-N6)-threonylcarbamoyltransferase complex transferase subunit TsaD [Candidatus Levybacteria bacterium CG_4_10_14_0_2_um_filter_36_16]|nr:MAG: tRNA (adenosine(37)-N6)-threonylcarbamoyltransferase complex transferase subunit TsaD [Candidatus Levybacteria bacterium CG2_30_37_29]PIR79209.1 MAG: tRNA (adenosine(37)-N6)-threonylcarbamoyltransferase complex transferase subunit TsaD [Candidatus Levybacteria bacterium CG10_big_fil_rev_8_21_14_0_10_36_30]PIZ97083.1 MAG: tRNA (adenosine(37)-N6)-threonylcarbamoyltransferase complex transferase subunit TsaD [Candidatus Levybacteria bacterium CG_4_10_14_0_2_um_filter_36_16]